MYSTKHTIDYYVGIMQEVLKGSNESVLALKTNLSHIDLKIKKENNARMILEEVGSLGVISRVVIDIENHVGISLDGGGIHSESPEDVLAFLCGLIGNAKIGHDQHIGLFLAA